MKFSKQQYSNTSDNKPHNNPKKLRELREYKSNKLDERLLEQKRIKALEDFSHYKKVVSPDDEELSNENNKLKKEVIEKQEEMNLYLDDCTKPHKINSYSLRPDFKFRNVSYLTCDKSDFSSVSSNNNLSKNNFRCDDDSNYTETVKSARSSVTSFEQFEEESFTSQSPSVTDKTKLAINEFMFMKPLDKSRSMFSSNYFFENLRKDPIEYSPDPPTPYDFDLDEESEKLMITADTDSIYFCHHNIAESLNSFSNDNCVFEMCNYFMFFRTMSSSRNRIFFTSGRYETINDENSKNSASMSEFPSVYLLKATISSKYEKRNIPVHFDIYYSLLKPDNYGHF